MRLEKNKNELKETIFQFLRSDKRLQLSKDAQKEKKDISFPTIPKLNPKN